MDESLQAHLQLQFEAHLGIPSPARLENSDGPNMSPGPANQGYIQKSWSTRASEEPAHANSPSCHADSRVEPGVEMLDELRPTLKALVADCDPATSIQEMTTIQRETRKQRSQQPLPLQQKLPATKEARKRQRFSMLEQRFGVGPEHGTTHLRSQQPARAQTLSRLADPLVGASSLAALPRHQRNEREQRRRKEEADENADRAARKSREARAARVAREAAQRAGSRALYAAARRSACGRNVGENAADCCAGSSDSIGVAANDDSAVRRTFSDSSSLAVRDSSGAAGDTIPVAWSADEHEHKHRGVGKDCSKAAGACVPLEGQERGRGRAQARDAGRSGRVNTNECGSGNARRARARAMPQWGGGRGCESEAAVRARQARRRQREERKAERLRREQTLQLRANDRVRSKRRRASHSTDNPTRSEAQASEAGASEMNHEASACAGPMRRNDQQRRTLSGAMRQAARDFERSDSVLSNVLQRTRAAKARRVIQRRIVGASAIEDDEERASDKLNRQRRVAWGADAARGGGKPRLKQKVGPKSRLKPRPGLRTKRTRATTTASVETEVEVDRSRVLHGRRRGQKESQASKVLPARRGHGHSRTLDSDAAAIVRAGAGAGEARRDARRRRRRREKREQHEREAEAKRQREQQREERRRRGREQMAASRQRERKKRMQLRAAARELCAADEVEGTGGVGVGHNAKARMRAQGLERGQLQARARQMANARSQEARVRARVRERARNIVHDEGSTAVAAPEALATSTKMRIKPEAKTKLPPRNPCKLEPVDLHESRPNISVNEDKNTGASDGDGDIGGFFITCMGGEFSELQEEINRESARLEGIRQDRDSPSGNAEKASSAAVIESTATSTEDTVVKKQKHAKANVAPLTAAVKRRKEQMNAVQEAADRAAQRLAKIHKRERALLDRLNLPLPTFD